MQDSATGEPNALPLKVLKLPTAPLGKIRPCSTSKTLLFLLWKCLSEGMGKEVWQNQDVTLFYNNKRNAGLNKCSFFIAYIYACPFLCFFYLSTFNIIYICI